MSHSCTSRERPRSVLARPAPRVRITGSPPRQNVVGLAVLLAVIVFGSILVGPVVTWLLGEGSPTAAEAGRE